MAALPPPDGMSVVERIWGYDASLWTGSDEDRWLGWLDVVTRVRGHVDELNAFAEAATEQFHDCVLLGMGGSSLAPEVLRRTFDVESFHVLDTTHPEAIRRLERERRPRADALPRLLEVGLDDRDALAARVLLGADRRPRGAVRRDHRSRLGAGRPRARARLPRRLRGRAGDRRPLLGALDVRDRAGGADGRRRRPLPPDRGGDGDRVPRGGRQPGPRARARARRGVAGGTRQGLHRRVRDRLRPLGRAAARGVDREARARGSCPRPGESPDGPDRQRARARSRRPLRPRRRALPLGVRDRRRRATCSGSTRSTSRTCRRRRTRRTRCSPRESRSSSRAGRWTSCSRRRRPAATTSASRRSSIRPARTSWRRSSSARTRPAASSRTGLGPRYLHSTGQLHKGGPDTGLFVQVVDETGDECRSPAATSASAA